MDIEIQTEGEPRPQPETHVKRRLDFHFAVGHFCAGCDLSTVSHSGCVVEKNVVIAEGETLPRRKQIRR